MRETTLVLLEFRPVTGKQVTGTWHATRDEVLEEFAGYELQSVEVNDMRIHGLRVLLEECEAAYRKDGSPGVSGVLAGRALSRAHAECNRASADLDDARVMAAAAQGGHAGTE